MRLRPRRVYVYDCSRITRDKDDFLDVVNVIRSKKASLISISQELNTSSPDADNKIKVLMGLETEELNNNDMEN